MKALDRKLWRDLGRLRGQVLTIALVVAAGIAAFVTLRSTWASLETARRDYYARYRFGDVFAQLERAPDWVAGEIATIPGVAEVHTRILRQVMVPMPDLPEPATGRLVSIPDDREPPLNGLYLRAGRLPEPRRDDEVVVIDSFAAAHHLQPGDRLPAVINGTLRQLRIVGIALSPEYVFVASAADFAADYERFAVLWMARPALAPAFEMEGGVRRRGRAAPARCVRVRGAAPARHAARALRRARRGRRARGRPRTTCSRAS